MTSAASPRPRWLEPLISLVVLLFLVVYTVAYFQAPDPGFKFDTNGHLTEITSAAQQPPGLQVGDQLLQVGSVTWTSYKELERPFFSGIAPGQVVVVRVRRGGQIVDVPWRLPSLNLADTVDRVVNIWLIGYVFWLAGTLALLALRPRDERWRLLVALDFLIAVWVVAGALSGSRLLGSGIVLRAGIWLSLPVFLHLHWVFPRPLGRLPVALLIAGYLVGLGLALAEVVHLLPSSAYLLGFVAELLGSLLLLVLQALMRPVNRSDLRLVMIGAAVALAPAAIVGVVGLVADINSTLAGALFGLPALPFAYLYVIGRRRLGGLELRVNRAISFYLFLIISLPLMALAAALAEAWLRLPGQVVALAIGALLAAVGVFGFAPFQKLVETRLLHIPPAPDRLLQTYVERTTASLERPALIELVRAQVLPALLVEQSALLQVDTTGRTHALYAEHVSPDELPGAGDLPVLVSMSGRYRPPDGAQAPFAWVRLALPMVVEGRLSGLWLFGRRPPDDYYSLGEVEALQSLAHQTAMAMSYIAQTERLRRLYQANINQREAERTRVARELHDDVLSGLAALLLRLDGTEVSYVATGLQAVVRRIRQTIGNLRPAVLDHGLWQALAQLADELAEADPSLAVRLEIPPSQARYDPQAEQHLYRIVQQACENARTHARARSLLICGELAPQRVSLSVEDDGTGFSLGPAANFDEHLAGLVQAGRYGLAGMVERANLIGADLRFDTAPDHGTRVNLTWASTGPPTTRPADYQGRQST